MRDKLKDKKHFEDFIDQTERRICNFSNKLNNKEIKEDRVLSVEKKINLLKYELIEAKYSNGEKIENLIHPFYEYLSEFSNYWASSNYIGLLWNLSLDIMLNLKSVEFIKLKNLLEKNNLNDFLIDFLINSKNENWTINSTEFQFEKPYKSLKEVINLSKTDKQKAVERLKKYLDKEWYKGHSGMGWYDSHKEKLLLYSGYWCWESGALVKILGLDDTILKEQQYYPYDMVHFK